MTFLKHQKNVILAIILRLPMCTFYQFFLKTIQKTDVIKISAIVSGVNIFHKIMTYFKTQKNMILPTLILDKNN